MCEPVFAIHRLHNYFLYGRFCTVFSTADITQAAKEIVHEDEWDFDNDFITARRVGRVMAALRLFEISRPGGIGPRKRRATLRDIQRLAESYGIPIPTQLVTASETDDTGQEHDIDGSNGPERASSQVSFDDFVKSSNFPDTSRPCYACGKTNWQSYPEGNGHFCATCHPIN